MGKQMWFQQIHPGWWALLCILVVGFWLQLSGYNNGLVVQDWDEDRFYAEMLYRLEGGEALKKQTLIGYSPLMFVLDEAAHWLTADPAQPPLTPHILPVISLLKLWAVCVNTLTAVFLALCGRLLSSWRVGLSAALIWLVLPNVTIQTVRGLTEAWQVCAMTSSAYFLLLALSRGKAWAAVASTIGAILAFLFKYSSFPIFGPGIVVTLWQMRRAPRQWIVTFIIQCVLITVVGLFAMQEARAQVAFNAPEPARFFDGHLLDRLTDPSVTAHVWRSTAKQLSLPPYNFSLAISLLITTLALILTPITWKRVGLILIWGVAVLHLFLINAYMIRLDGVQRYTTPATALWVLVIMVSVGWIMHYMIAKRWQRSAQWIFAIGFALWLTFAFQTSAANAFINAQPSTKAEYMQWIYSSVPNDGAMLVSDADRWHIDHIYWGERVSRVWYDSYVGITELTRQEWLDKGILYATVTQYDLDHLNMTEQGKQDLESMLRLKKFPRSGWAPENLYVYYLPSYQAPDAGPVVFDNGLTLMGCRLTDASEPTERRLRVQCLWQSDHAQTQAWKLYAHIVPLDSREPLAQADGPLTLPTRPEDTWNDAEEVLVGSAYTISLPADLDSQSIRLMVGLYNSETGQRAMHDGADFVALPLPPTLWDQGQ